MDDAERAFRDALHRVDSVKIPVPSLEPADVHRTPGLGIMMGRWLAAAAVLAMVAGIAVWALAGRGQVASGIPAAPSSAAAPARLTGTTWIAAEFYGKPTDFAGDKMPFIEFRTDSTYRGGDPCNGVGGSYRLVGNDLQISPPGAMTEMGCNVAQQQTFLKVLEDTRRVYRDGDSIELLDQSGSVLARFRSSDAYTVPGPTPSATPAPTPTAEVTPSIGPAPVIRVRVRNTSSVYFSDVYAVFPNGEKVHYGPIPAGGTSKYESVLEAYSYTYLRVKAGGRTYVYQPDDYVGESVLPDGQYSYALNLVGSRIDLALEHD
jgi:heat shock protein HslJ